MRSLEVSIGAMVKDGLLRPGPVPPVFSLHRLGLKLAGMAIRVAVAAVGSSHTMLPTQ